MPFSEHPERAVLLVVDLLFSCAHFVKGSEVWLRPKAASFNPEPKATASGGRGAIPQNAGADHPPGGARLGLNDKSPTLTMRVRKQEIDN